MRSEPSWLEPEEVIALNKLIVEGTGEGHTVLNAGLLESALNRPYNHWSYDLEDDVVCLAVTLLFGIARNHCFEQGNKRTAFEAAIIFMEMNGYTLHAPDRVELAELICRVIEHRFSEAEFEKVIRDYVVPLPDEVDE